MTILLVTWDTVWWTRAVLGVSGDLSRFPGTVRACSITKEIYFGLLQLPDSTRWSLSWPPATYWRALPRRGRRP